MVMRTHISALQFLLVKLCSVNTSLFFNLLPRSINRYIHSSTYSLINKTIGNSLFCLERDINNDVAVF